MGSYMDAASIQRKTVLYVGGLEESVTEKTLEAAFLPFGDLVQILLPKDANSSQPHHTTHSHPLARIAHHLPSVDDLPYAVLCRGASWLWLRVYEDPLDAAEAVFNLDEGQLFGRTLRVKLAKPNAIATQSVWAQKEEESKESEEQQHTGSTQDSAR